MWWKGQPITLELLNNDGPGDLMAWWHVCVCVCVLVCVCTADLLCVKHSECQTTRHGSSPSVMMKPMSRQEMNELINECKLFWSIETWTSWATICFLSPLIIPCHDTLSWNVHRKKINVNSSVINGHLFELTISITISRHLLGGKSLKEGNTVVVNSSLRKGF